MSNSQEATVSLEFKNAEIAEKLIKNYTVALQNGDIDKMNAQLHEKALIYGLGGVLDLMNVEQHREYYRTSTKQYKHSISGDLYLPVKVENNWNAGEWLLSGETNTVTNKQSGLEIPIPYHAVFMV